MLKRNVVQKFLHQGALPAGAFGAGFGAGTPLFHTRVPEKEYANSVGRQQRQQQSHRQQPKVAATGTVHPHLFPYRIFAAPSETTVNPQALLHKMQHATPLQHARRQQNTPKSEDKKEGARSPQTGNRSSGAYFSPFHPLSMDSQGSGNNEMPPEMREVFSQLFGHQLNTAADNARSTTTPQPETKRTNKTNVSTTDAPQAPQARDSGASPNTPATAATRPPQSPSQQSPSSKRAKPAVYEGQVSSTDGFTTMSTAMPAAATETEVSSSSAESSTTTNATGCTTSTPSSVPKNILSDIVVQAAEYPSVRDVTITGLPGDCVVDDVVGGDHPTLSMELDEVRHIVQVVCQYKPRQDVTPPSVHEGAQQRVKIDGVGSLSGIDGESLDIVTQLMEQPPVHIPGELKWRCEIPVPPTTTLDQITPFISTSSSASDGSDSTGQKKTNTTTLRLAIQKPQSAVMDASRYVPKKISFCK